jgi:hypothetical protein
MEDYKLNIDELIQQVEDSVITLDSGMKFAKHPLYNTIWSHESMEVEGENSKLYGRNWLKRYLQHKLETINNAIEEHDWSRAIFMHERPWRCDVLLQVLLSGICLINDDTADLVLDVWVDTESPHQSRETWLRIFGLVSTRLLNAQLDDKERKERDELPDKLTVYRGTCMDEIRSGNWGFAWTLDRDKAEWFATRFEQDDPVLITTTVNKSDVTGVLHRRGEAEIIIHPMMLRNETVLEEL